MEPGLVGGELVEDEMHTEGTPIFRQLICCPPIHPLGSLFYRLAGLEMWKSGRERKDS